MSKAESTATPRSRRGARTALRSLRKERSVTMLPALKRKLPLVEPMDAEQCAMAYRMAEGIRWDDFDEALAAVRDVGPGGHYLGHQHTQDNFQRAFFMPKLFDNNSIEQWQAEGSREINERALDEVKGMLDAYIEPKLDPAVDEALLDYIARRERQIPAVDALNNE